MALWQKVKQLNSTALGDITSLYTASNIPIEVRDYCAIWIEASIKHLTAESFVTGLISQIREKLQSLIDSPTAPFYVTRRITDFQNSLSTVHTVSPEVLFRQFVTCLDAENRIVRKHEEYVMMRVPEAPSATHATNDMVPSLEQMITGMSDMGQGLPSTPSSIPAYSNELQPEESTEICDTFSSNPTRIVIDSDMNLIFEAVWSLEESSNMFAFKCIELKRLQGLKDQSSATVNGISQLQAFTEHQELEGQLNETRAEVVQTATIMWNKTNDVRNRTINVLQNWTQLKHELDREIINFIQEQRLYANGKPMQMNIKDLQRLAEYLMEVAWKLRKHLLTTDKIRNANVSIMIDNSNTSAIPTIPEHLATVTSLITKLVQDTFLVVHQPCQVLKTNTRFHVSPGRSPMEIRILVGDKLNLQLNPPSVSVALIDEKTCREIETTGLAGEKFNKISKKGRLLPENTRMDFSHETNCSTAIFRQISLKDFYRNGRKTTIGKEQAECVTEEKFALLFRSEFDVGDMKFKIWRMSLPLVITTHGSQDSLAWAAVTWDNTFCQPGRVAFNVPDHAGWAEISEMLNYKFLSMTGSPLTDDNLKYFYERLSYKPGFPHSMSWNEMCKVNLPDRKFTFWDWFFEGARLIEQHLKEAWKDGFVKGFIGKEVSENMLCRSGCQPGTFLFRFSESVLGGLSIVWLHSDGKAYSLNPFKSKDLLVQPLVEKLRQETLHYVFPNIPKQTAFKKYYDDHKSGTKTVESARVGYVTPILQLVIDNPNIPRFRLAEKTHSVSENSAMVVPSNQDLYAQRCEIDNTVRSNDENIIDIDIEKIVDFLAAQEYLMDASPVQSYRGNSNEFTGDREGPSSTGIQENYVYSPEESFYMEL